MKKYALILLILFLTAGLFSCKKEKDYKPEITAFLQKWTISIRDLNYTDYKNMVKYVKSETQFNEKYRYYYPEQPVILDIKKYYDDGNILRFRLNVSFYGIDRAKKVKKSDINSILIVEKKGKEYKVDETIFIDNKYN
ncbi:MAG: hypothetical protein JW982_09935 [Spirochaetes bacterium]|nr:hypothetical protein [Spirochaetota bacterium]